MNYESSGADGGLDMTGGTAGANAVPPQVTSLQQRIEDLRAQALTKSNPLTAVVACLTAGMAEMASRLEATILATSQLLPAEDSSRRRGQPPTDTYLGLVKQIGRNAHLEMRLDHLDEQRAAVRSSAADRGPADLPGRQDEIPQS